MGDGRKIAPKLRVAPLWTYAGGGRSVGLYHQQLSYCIVQYIEKDPNTAIAILRGLFKYWPWSSASKQVSL